MREGNLTSVEVVSFGYKYGPPPEANLVLDVRSLENPYYHDTLRPLTGADEPVQEFLLAKESTADFIAAMRTVVSLSLRGWLEFGSDHKHVTLAFGCTGGKHRSRFCAIKALEVVQELVAELKLTSQVTLTHRDDGKE